MHSTMTCLACSSSGPGEESWRQMEIASGYGRYHETRRARSDKVNRESVEHQDDLQSNAKCVESAWAGDPEGESVDVVEQGMRASENKSSR